VVIPLIKISVPPVSNDNEDDSMQDNEDDFLPSSSDEEESKNFK